MAAPHPAFRVALVSAPWPMFHRPSIQLGTLKAFVGREIPEIAARAFTPYLQVAVAVGYPAYRAVSERTWAAESVFSALLFPDRAEKAEALFRRQARKSPALKTVDFKSLCRGARAAADAFVDGFEKVDLAGFSISLCQLTASLYLIEGIRRRFPDLAVVVGGSALDVDLIADLVEARVGIDYGVYGEGEKPLTALIRGLRSGAGPEDLGRIDGIVARTGSGAACTGVFHQVENLDALPEPDYGDYFRELSAVPADLRFFPTLMLEASRGCWWRKPGAGGRGKGCAFCTLNRQWKGYRTKSAGRIRAEIEGLCRRHRLLSVSFVDNVLPPGSGEAVFRGLAETGKDFSFFAELRAATGLTELGNMARAGLREVQTGIEALSTGLLKKMNKGTTALDNLEAMKHCEQLSIVNRANLICQFPGSDEKDVAETLRVLEFAAVFRPLRIVSFWLGRGSAVWADPAAYGIRAVFAHPRYRFLFPEDLAARLRFPVLDHRGDAGRQKRLWAPVLQRVRRWQREYARLQATACEPILSYQDGGSFLLVRHRRVGDSPATHRLQETSAAIYRFCGRSRSLAEIREAFPALARDRIRAFLDLMVEKRLMYLENDRCLSLAVRRRAADSH